jgi:TetR/AcrR family transcriptional regulator, lmrAB and yxaGH operons repressor
MCGMAESSLTRAHLVDQLCGVFERNGYAGATLAQLAQATGLSKSSLYHHFPGGKSEMAAVLVRHAITDLQHRAFGRLDGVASARSRLEAFLAGFAEYVEDGRGHCLLAVLAQAEMPPALRGQIAAQLDDWVDALRRVLEEAGMGSKRAARVSGELMNQLYGSLVVGKMLNRPDHFSRTIRRLLKQVRKST